MANPGVKGHKGPLNPDNFGKLFKFERNVSFFKTKFSKGTVENVVPKRPRRKNVAPGPQRLAVLVL